MIKITLNIDTESFRTHAEEQGETDPQTIKKYILEDIMDALGTLCLDSLPDLVDKGLAEKQAEITLVIRDDYEDIILPIGDED